MKPDDRLQEILNIVNDEARVLISDLTKVLKVSEMTIRRDIEHLSRLGLLRREKGFVHRGDQQNAHNDENAIHRHAPDAIVNGVNCADIAVHKACHCAPFTD